MASRYLILSDLHLCDTEDHADGWKRYKSSRYVTDGELAELLDEFAREANEGHDLCCILNGDVFDFDLVWDVPTDPPWPVRGWERRRGLAATEAKSIWRLEKILADHGRFLEALCLFLAQGHRLVYVLGNHDRELAFEGVQGALLAALRDTAAGLGLELPDDPVQFEPWFYYEKDRIYVEHGNQYDYYSSYPFVLDPTFESGGERYLTLPMGNLSNRFLMNKIGFFNPHATDFILNAFAYFMHWWRYYAFTRRSLVFSWLIGSFATLWALLRQKSRTHSEPKGYRERMSALAERAGVEESCLWELEKLRQPPITNRLFRMVREFWIDRVIALLLFVGGTVALALVPIPLWIKLMVPLAAFPTLFFIYEWAARGESLLNVEATLPEFGRHISRIMPARVVSFGHTHQPRLLPLDRDTTFVDSGTWAPMFDRINPEAVEAGLWNFVRVELDGHEASVELGSLTPPSERACGESAADEA